MVHFFLDGWPMIFVFSMDILEKSHILTNELRYFYGDSSNQNKYIEHSCHNILGDLVGIRQSVNILISSALETSCCHIPEPPRSLGDTPDMLLHEP